MNAFVFLILWLICAFHIHTSCNLVYMHLSIYYRGAYLSRFFAQKRAKRSNFLAWVNPDCSKSDVSLKFIVLRQISRSKRIFWKPEQKSWKNKYYLCTFPHLTWVSHNFSVEKCISGPFASQSTLERRGCLFFVESLPQSRFAAAKKIFVVEKFFFVPLDMWKTFYFPCKKANNTLSFFSTMFPACGKVCGKVLILGTWVGITQMLKWKLYAIMRKAIF